WGISLSASSLGGKLNVEDTNLNGPVSGTGETEVGLIQTETWYRVSGTVTSTQATVNVYNADSDTPLVTLTPTGTFGPVGFFHVRLGNTLATNPGNVYIAHVLVTDGEEPPAYTAVKTAAALSWWDGASEVPLQGLQGPAGEDAVAYRGPTISDLISETPFFIAHRGSGDEFPEHTLEAYESVLASGAKAIEISAHPTAEGTFVCIHDATLDRTTDSTGMVNQSTLAKLRAGVRVNMSRYLGPQWAPSITPIRPSTLREVLDELVGKAVLFVEMKQGT